MSDASTDLNQDSVQKFVTWTRIMGVLYVILGGISCIGIITAALGIPEIFAGIRMQKAGEAVDVHREKQRLALVDLRKLAD